MNSVCIFASHAPIAMMEAVDACFSPTPYIGKEDNGTNTVLFLREGVKMKK